MVNHRLDPCPDPLPEGEGHLQVVVHLQVLLFRWQRTIHETTRSIMEHELFSRDFVVRLFRLTKAWALKLKLTHYQLQKLLPGRWCYMTSFQGRNLRP